MGTYRNGKALKREGEIARGANGFGLGPEGRNMDKRRGKTTESLSFWNRKQFGEDGKKRWNDIPVSPNDEREKEH